MSFNTALTAPQLTKLRSASYAGEYQITLCKNRVVFAGVTAANLIGPWSVLTYGAISVGAYTDVYPGMVVVISTTSDIKEATFWGRVKWSGAQATFLNVNRNSTSWSVGVHFWVIDSWSPDWKRSGAASASDPELVDGDQPYQGMQPAVIGLRTAYVDNVDSISGKLRVAFDVSASFAKQSGATMASYLFIFRAGTYTVISGALASAVVTVDFNPGEQWGLLQATDSSGVTKTRHFYINAHNAANPPDTGFDGQGITCDLQRGWNLSVPAFADVDSVMSNTFCVVWRANEMYGGVAGGLTTNNIAFIGWLQSESDSVIADPTNIASETTFQFTGVGSRLGQLTAQDVPFYHSASPTLWGQIKQLTPWRAVAHFLDSYTTLGDLCDLNFDTHDDTYLFPTLPTQGGSALSVIQALAAKVVSVIEFAPDGRIQMIRDATYLNTAQRTALTTVADWTSQDAAGSLVKSLDENKTVGKVDGDGAWYNTSNAQTVDYTGRAPGIVQESAQGSDNLSNQILPAGTVASVALAELLQRMGDKFAAANNNEVIECEHPDGYVGFVPSRGQLFTWTLSGLVSSGVNRITYVDATKWLLESVNYTRNDNGETAVRHRYHKLQAVGQPGIDTTYIPPGEIPIETPPIGFPPFPFELPPEEAPITVNPIDLNPPNAPLVPKDGNFIVAASTTQSFTEKNFIKLHTPNADENTPSDLGSYLIKQILLDPFATKTASGAYILASDGTNSAVWYTPNIATASPVWTKGADMAGVYTVIRATKTPGGIEIWGPLVAPPTGSGTLITMSYTGGYGTTGPSTVRAGQLFTVQSGPVINQGIYGTFAGMEFNGSPDSGTMTIQAIGGGYSLKSPITDNDNISGGINGFGIRYDQINNVDLRLYMPHTYAGGNGVIGCTITSPTTFFANFYYDTVSASITDSGAAYSPNNGANFYAPVSTGLSPGSIGGFDVQRSGTVSYGAAAGKVRKATTIAGAYSDWYSVPSAANPVCIIIPYYKRNVATLNTATSTPDVVAACDNGKLYWIDGAAATATDITPTGVTVFDNANCITTAYGNHIACFGKVGAIYHLFTSTNGGTSWTDRGAVTTPTFIRSRRNDSSSLKGTLYGQIILIAGGSAYYSSFWFSRGQWIRIQPVNNIITADWL